MECGEQEDDGDGTASSHTRRLVRKERGTETQADRWSVRPNAHAAVHPPALSKLYPSLRCT